MTKLFTALPVAALLAFSGAAYAQEATTTEDAAVAPIETDLNMGEDASAPVVGQTYVKETIEDWEMQCIRVEDGEEPCQMYQLMNDAENNPVAEISFFRLPDGGQAVAGATVVVPLETALAAQLRIAVDGGKGKRYPYSFCNQVGCFARIGLTSGDINGFKKGAKAVVTIVPFAAPDQTVDLNMSLKGFTAAYGNVTVLKQ